MITTLTDMETIKQRDWAKKGREKEKKLLRAIADNISEEGVLNLNSRNILQGTNGEPVPKVERPCYQVLDFNQIFRKSEWYANVVKLNLSNNKI